MTTEKALKIGIIIVSITQLLTVVFINMLVNRQKEVNESVVSFAKVTTEAFQNQSELNLTFMDYLSKPEAGIIDPDCNTGSCILSPEEQKGLLNNGN